MAACRSQDMVFHLFPPQGYYYGPPPPMSNPNGDDSSSYARRDGSNSVKNVGDLCRWVVIGKKIRERKSLGSFRLDFKLASWKRKCVLQRVADAEVDCFSVLFWRKLCLFFSSIWDSYQIWTYMWLAHSFLREVVNCRFPWRIFPTRGSHLQLKSCIMLGIRPALTFLEGQRKDASLRLLKFSGFDLSSGQWYPYLGVNCMLDRLLLVVMICATWLWFHQSKLYRFEVGNILGEVQDTINRRYGIYLHHSDLSMEQADGNPVHRGYNFLDVVFSSLSSNWGQNFTPGYKICNLVVTYEQNIESLMLQEEVHLVMWEQWFAELVWFLEKRWKRRVASSNMSQFVCHLRDVEWESMFHLELHFFLNGLMKCA